MVTSQYNCHIFAWHIKLQKMQATKHNTFLMPLCKDSKACSKWAILFSCSLTTEQQLWHFVTHNSSGYKVLKALRIYCDVWFSYNGIGLIGCIFGIEWGSCTQPVAKDYILKKHSEFDFIIHLSHFHS